MRSGVEALSDAIRRLETQNEELLVDNVRLRARIEELGEQCRLLAEARGES